MREAHAVHAGQEAMARYILPLMAVDPEGILFMTAFNDQATQLMGMPAQELKKLKDKEQQLWGYPIDRSIDRSPPSARVAYCHMSGQR